MENIMDNLAMPKKMERRTFLKGALGGTGLVFLGACSANSSGASSASGKPGDWAGALIKGVMQDASVPGDQYRSLVAPGWAKAAKGNMQLTLTDYDSLYQDVVLDVTNATDNHDVMGLDLLWTGQFGVGESVAPLNAMFDANADLKKNVNKVLLQGSTWAGHIVGLPATNQSWNLFYRKDVFDKYGYQPPTNWTDFLALAKELTGDWANDGQEHYGVAFNVLRGAPVAHDWLGYFGAMGGMVFDHWPDAAASSYKPQLNGDAAHAALQLNLQMMNYAPPDVTEYDWNKTQGALASGRVAMICSWNDGTASQVFVKGSKTADLVSWARLPNAPGIERFDPRGFWSIGINRNSGRRPEAFDYLAYGLSKDVQRQMVENVPGIVPVRDDLLAEMKTATGPMSYLGFMQELNKNPNPMNFAWRPNVPEWSSVQDILGLTINQALTKQASAAAALNSAQSQLSAAMVQAGHKDA
jgi:multiple sugar transport system substrate-binding protein